MALVEHLDIYPTLVDAAGLQIPAATMGRSMVPLLGAPPATSVTYDLVAGITTVWNASYSQINRGVSMGFSMRTDRWRVTRSVYVVHASTPHLSNLVLLRRVTRGFCPDMERFWFACYLKERVHFFLGRKGGGRIARPLAGRRSISRQLGSSSTTTRTILWLTLMPLRISILRTIHFTVRRYTLCLGCSNRPGTTGNSHPPGHQHPSRHHRAPHRRGLGSSYPSRYRLLPAEATVAAAVPKAAHVHPRCFASPLRALPLTRWR